MVNILVPMGGKSQFFEGSQFAKQLIDVKGKPMVQHVIEQFKNIEQKKFIFVVNQDDCDNFHLDSVLRLATDDNCEILKVQTNTKGAVCSSLIAIEHINNDEELIISNGDQVIEIDFNEVLGHYKKHMLDGGVISFESLHPKWSFIRLDKGLIVETAEKRPISKKAIAGFYYFKKGSDFVDASMHSIEKDANVNGLYYIAPVMNEMILKNKKLGAYEIEASQYHSFYSPEKLKQYEKQ